MLRSQDDWYDEPVPDPEFVRVTDEADLARWWQIDDATMAADHVGLPADPMSELLPVLAGPVAGFDVALWLAVVAGTPVGAVKLSLPLHDNRHVATLDVAVHPDQRGRGYGGQVIEAMVSRIRDLGRSVVQVEICRPLGEDPGPSPATRIATRLGAVPAHVEWRRVLDVAAPEPAGLADLAAAAAGVAKDYSLVQWVGRAAEPDLEDLTELMAMMSTDAPQGELDVEPEVWDVARYLANQDDAEARGRRRYAVAARDEVTGRLVGFTDIGVNLAAPAVGYQWDTLVRRDHRGHRLGLLMKLANLRQLRAQSPQTRYLNTWNAVSNTPMVSVNEALGYRPVEAWEEWQLHL